MAEIAGLLPLDRFILRGAGPFARDVPTRPLSSRNLRPCAALWLGPDEWLILAHRGQGASFAARVGADEDTCALVDVSDRQLGFMLGGADADLLLNGAVPLDLSHAAFPVGMCTRTLFDKAEIVLWRRAADAWHLEVARSFAPYVRSLLAAIARADGIPLSDAEPCILDIPAGPADIGGR